MAAAASAAKVRVSGYFFFSDLSDFSDFSFSFSSFFLPPI